MTKDELLGQAQNIEFTKRDPDIEIVLLCTAYFTSLPKGRELLPTYPCDQCVNINGDDSQYNTHVKMQHSQ